MKATNIEGREIFFSASSSDAFKACPRRWWFAKVMMQTEPSDPSLMFGTAVHLVLEKYLQTGEIVAPGDYKEAKEIVTVTDEHISRAKAGFDLLPAPGAYQVENWLPRIKIVDDTETMSVVGKIDMYLTASEAPAPYHHAAWPDDVTGHVLDHKTSSDPKRWMPTSEALATNPQGLLYAGALQKGGLIAPGDVLFTHHYVSKKGAPKSYIVHTTMRHDNIEEHWDRQGAVAREMVKVSSSIRNISHQGDVRANLAACRSYGRLCPFAGTCEAQKPKGLFAALDTFDAARKGQTIQEDPPMSGGLFNKLRGRSDAPPPKINNPEPAPAPAKAAPVAKREIAAVAVMPPDATPMDVALVSGAMLRDAASVLRECNLPSDPLTLSEMREILVSETVPPEYHHAVIAAVDPDALANTPYASLASLSPSDLLHGGSNTDDALAAIGGASTAAAPMSVEEEVVESESVIGARALLAVHNPAGFKAVAERAALAILQAARTMPKCRNGSPFDWQIATIDSILSTDVTVPARSKEPTAAVVDDRVWDNRDTRYVAAGREILRLLGEGRIVTEQDALQTMRSAGFERPHTKTARALLVQAKSVHAGTLIDRNIVQQAPLPAPEPEPAPAPAQVAPAPAQVAPAPAQVATKVAPELEINNMTMILVQAAIQGAGVEPTMLRDMSIVQQAIGRVGQRVQAEHNMPWELFNNYGDTGPKRVIVEVQSALAREGLPKGVFYVERTDPLVSADILTLLRQAGAVVVRGAI